MTVEFAWKPILWALRGAWISIAWVVGIVLGLAAGVLALSAMALMAVAD
jgi:hypothetical protein